MSETVIMFDATRDSGDMRREIPIAITDRFAYFEHEGRRVAIANQIEVPRLEALGDLELLSPSDLGNDELIAQGILGPERALHLVLRACERLGIAEAVVPPRFPLDAAEFLAEHGVRVRTDAELFERRRRVKTPTELEGIRRAQAVADRAMEAMRSAIRDQQSPTSESVRESTRAAVGAEDVRFEYLFASVGPQALSGHDPGSGPIVNGQAVVVDFGVQDNVTGCWCDMSRTFCRGDVPDHVREWHDLCRQALGLACGAIRPGAATVIVYEVVAQLFEEHGYSTKRTKQPGEVLDDGFFHALGHGVGHEIHEHPIITWPSDGELVAGDVLAIEPGLYRKSVGGCRLEDLVLVTDDGCEVITSFPYDLTA